MPTILRIKRRASGGGTSGPSTLAAAELAFNETSGSRILYYGLGDVSGNASSVIPIGGPDFVSSTIPNLTGVVTSVGTTTSIANAAITNAMLANTAVANLSGSNSGDNAVNSLYSSLISDKTVVLTAGTGVTVTGTYPSFTIAATGLGGTVTSVSVVSANGFAGTVSTATSTPAITISTSITGLIKGNGTALSAAVAATDYVAPGGALGTPSSGTLTNCTFPTLNQNTTGTAAGLSATLAVASGGTGVTTSTGTGAGVHAISPSLVTPDIGAATGTSLVLSGNLTVNGTTTTISSSTLVVGDKNIVLASASTTDAGADGGGITIKGLTDKTFNWIDATDSWTSSEHIDLATGKVLKINGTTVLSATALSGVDIDGGSF
jgi:hypothetical protein